MMATVKRFNLKIDTYTHHSSVKHAYSDKQTSHRSQCLQNSN